LTNRPIPPATPVQAKSTPPERLSLVVASTMLLGVLTLAGCADMADTHGSRGHSASSASSHPASTGSSSSAPVASTGHPSSPVSAPTRSIHDTPTIRAKASTDPGYDTPTVDVTPAPASDAVQAQSLAITEPEIPRIEPPEPLQDGPYYLVRFGMIFGGDILANVQFDDGTTGNLRAGTGEQLSVGGGYNFAGPLSAEVSLGVISDSTFFDDSSAGFYRFPLEGIVLYRLNDWWRIGGGVQRLFLTQIQGGLPNSTGPTKFNDTNGAIYTVEFAFDKNVSLGFRCVTERLTANGFTGTLSGNQYGLFVSGRFH
jgi:hypothetical protein